MPLRVLPAALVALSVLAVPTAASAAMGGANALTTTLRPDLRSATIQSTNEVDDTTTVRVCFSKAIASLPQAVFFHMGTYVDDDAGDPIDATSATRSTSNCADAVFPNADSAPFTYVTVDGSDGTAPDSGTSAVSSNGFGNIRDSTALIGSNTHNGTRGFAEGPDLAGISVNNAQAFIDFTFDQRVGGVNNAPSAFQYNTANGATVNSLNGAVEPRLISADGLTVRVFFPPGPQIQAAVRGITQPNAVSARSSSQSNQLRSSSRPGSGGFTDRPDLVAVIPAPDGSFVDFQFDQVLTAVPGVPGDFTVGHNFGNGTSSPAVLPTILGGAGVGNTARALMPDGPTENEFWISGGVAENAVAGAGGPSTAGGLPAGGNVGAFATGFTLAPEALTVSFDNATDVVRVLFDQRWTVDNDTLFRLIDDQGSQIAGAPINVSGAGSPTAGRITAEITFPAGTVTGARSLLIQQGAVDWDNPGPFGPFENRPQVISPTAPAAKNAKRFRELPARR